jgi:hypothetical protein
MGCSLVLRLLFWCCPMAIGWLVVAHRVVALDGLAEAVHLVLQGHEGAGDRVRFRTVVHDGVELHGGVEFPAPGRFHVLRNDHDGREVLTLSVEGSAVGVDELVVELHDLLTAEVGDLRGEAALDGNGEALEVEGAHDFFRGRVFWNHADGSEQHEPPVPVGLSATRNSA